jgi:hypothetical protein
MGNMASGQAGQRKKKKGLESFENLRVNLRVDF